MKFDKFTIFLLLLGLLVIITLVMNFKKPLETFVDFQNQPAAGTAVYIPQYSADKAHTVTTLHDNLYFDQKNGHLIEVFAKKCTSGCDTTGKNITYLSVASRDAMSITAMPTKLDGNGNVQSYDSSQSKMTSIDPLYTQYVYTTSCANTNIYQVIYVSWKRDTYLHIIDLSASVTEGTNVKTIHMTSTGFADVFDSFKQTKLQPYSSAASTMIPTPTLPVATPQKYGSSVLTLGQDTPKNAVYYDVANGNILLNVNGKNIAYNRGGTDVLNTENPIMPWASQTGTISFILNDIPGLNIIVTASGDNTVINMLIKNGNKYTLIYTYRFNKSGIVTSEANDVVPTPTTPVPASKSVVGTSVETSGKIDTSGNSNVCGDDISCKWYWYFNTIAQKNGNGDTYFSDDYFLKTEAVPPVCPQCPQCSSSTGVCNNCGGSGGNGTCAPTSIPSTAGLPAGAIKDNSGNVYIPFTDSSGNIRYVLYSNQSSAKAPLADGLYNIPRAAAAPPGAIAIKKEGNDNFTFVDRDGKFLSTADPNTFGGVVSLTVFNAGSIANNLVSTAGGIVGTTADLAKDAGTGAVGLVKDSVSGVGGFAKDAASGVGGFAKDAASGAVGLAKDTVGLAKDTVGGVVGLAKDTVGGAVGLAKDTVGGAVGLLKDVGSGIGKGLDVRGNDGRQGAQGGVIVNNEVASTGSSLGYTPFGSDKTMGSVPGQTQIDNYSYYGALQSKGANYMPVTADFSAFRK